MKTKESLGYNHPLPTAIRKSIAAKGITQAALATAVDLQPGTISNYCNGERTPDAIALAKIAKTLDVSADYLLGFETDSAPSVQNAPEDITLKTCADAIRLIGFLANAIPDTFIDVDTEAVIPDFCSQVVKIRISDPGVVAYFLELKKMQDLFENASPAVKKYEERIKRDLLNEAESIAIGDPPYERIARLQSNDIEEDLPF